jgi:hypothetical protein
MTPDGQVAQTPPAPAADPAPAPEIEPVQEPEFDLDAAWKETVLDESGNTVLPDPAPAPGEGEAPAVEPVVAAPAEETTPAPTPAPATDPAPAEAPAAPAAPIAADPPSPPTPEEERQALLDEERAFDQRKRAFQTRTGQPLHNPADVQREIEGYEAYKALEDDMPDVLRGIDYAIAQRVKGFSDDLSAQVADGQMTHVEASQHEAVTILHSDYPLILKNPKHLLDWMDTIPGKDYQIALDTIDHGGTAEVNALMQKFKGATGITDYSELLGDPAPAPAAGALAPETPTPAAPAPSVTTSPAATPTGAPPDPKATELADNAAAVPGEGTGDPGITNSEAQTDEQAMKKEWESIPDDVL